MKKKVLIQQASFVLILIQFYLIAVMPADIGRHMLHHHSNADHAAQHSTVLCSWVCTALSVVHTEVAIPDSPLMPFHPGSPISSGGSTSRANIALYIRGPPLWVSLTKI